MADNQYVAVSEVKHGFLNDDGDNEVKVFKRGDVVEGLSAQEMVDLWVAGSIAKKGSSADPNTWPEVNEVQNTTPRFVEEALRHQLSTADAPEGVEQVSTREGGVVPKDPGSVLENEGPGQGKGAAAEPSDVGATSNSGPSAPVPEAVAVANQAKADDAQAKADAKQK